MRPSKRGFTILEVLLSVAVLAVSLIGGSALFYANQRNLTDADFQRLMTWKAVERMEAVKTRSYGLLDGENGTESITISGVPATRTTIVQTITESGAEYKRITVDVACRGKTVSMDTYITRP